MMYRTWTLLAITALPTLAQAGEIKISKVEASSTYPPEAGAFYTAGMIKDGKLGTSWVEGSSGAGLGETVTLILAGEAEVSEIRMWAGMWYSAEYWDRGNRPREIHITPKGHDKTVCELADVMEVQVCKLDKPVRTSEVMLMLKGAYSGSTWLDTAISEIQVHDSGAETWAAVTGATSSSTLADDGDGPYDALRASDGMADSMWCEGNEEGDGTGEWLEITFDGPRKITQVEVINGMGGSMTVWKKGNRGANAKLAFSDGSTKSVTLDDTHKRQTVAVPGVTTTSVKLSITSVTKGSQYNDLCVSVLRAK